MDVFTAIKTRRSIRGYQDRPVEEEKLNRVLEAGRLAPSARNAQGWKFVVVKDPETRKKLATAASNQQFVGEAPVVIVACALEERMMMCGQPAHTVDLSIAVDHMTLQAVEEDLGTCWIGAFHEDQVKQILGIPDDIRVVTMLPLGYPKHVPNPTPRKPPEETFVYDKWS